MLNLSFVMLKGDIWQNSDVPYVDIQVSYVEGGRYSNSFKNQLRNDQL